MLGSGLPFCELTYTTHSGCSGHLFYWFIVQLTCKVQLTHPRGEPLSEGLVLSSVFLMPLLSPVLSAVLVKLLDGRPAGRSVSHFPPFWNGLA